MLLRRISARAREMSIEHTQGTHVSDIELFPSLRRGALTLTANLIREERLDALPDSVIVWLHDARAPGFVDELNESLLRDSAQEIRVRERAALPLDGRQIESAETLRIGQDIDLNDLAAHNREAEHGKHLAVG